VKGMEHQPVDRKLVLTALRTLSTKHRQVLSECYLRGASVAEAAETLGVPPDTLKARIHYAMHALRRAIDVESRRTWGFSADAIGSKACSPTATCAGTSSRTVRPRWWRAAVVDLPRARVGEDELEAAAYSKPPVTRRR
jgi:Sigma-70, region 4